jgi:hypothetical protein
MLSLAAERPQDAEDLRRLIAKLEDLASTDPRKAPACRELLAKLTGHLPRPDPDPRRRPVF